MRRKAALRIPVIANGGTRVAGDVQRTLASTRADAVMSAQTLLANPRLFARRQYMGAGEPSLGNASSMDGEQVEDSPIGDVGWDESMNGGGDSGDPIELAYEYLAFAEVYPAVHTKSVLLSRGLFPFPYCPSFS